MKFRFLFHASSFLIYYLSNCWIQTAAQSSGKTHAVRRMCRSCSSMALEDSHGVHDHYATRLVLDNRNSKDFVSAVFTEMIIAAKKPLHARVIADPGIRAKVPVISFSAINPFIARGQMPYFSEMAKNEIYEFKSISSVILSYGGKQHILIYGETDYGSRRTVPYLIDELQKVQSGDQYKTSVSPLAGDSEILEELHKLSTMQTRVFRQHMSTQLGSLLLFKAKDIGIMSDSESNACIITEEMTSYGSSKLNGLSGEISPLSVIWTIIHVMYTEKEIGFWIHTIGLSRKLDGESQSNLVPIIRPGTTVNMPTGLVIQLKSKKRKIGHPTKLNFNQMVMFSGNHTIVTGFSIDVFNAVLEALPYDVPYELVPFEGSYGEPGGSYSNLVEQVFLKKFDAAVGDTIVTANRSGGVVHYRGTISISNGLNCTTHHQAFITIISTVSILSFVLHLLLYIFRNAIHSFWERLKGNFHIEHGERSEAHVLDGSNVMVSIDPNVFVKDSKQ